MNPENYLNPEKLSASRKIIWIRENDLDPEKIGLDPEKLFGS
jgi:hypothetical protein